MLPSEAVGETLLFFASFLFPLLSSTSIYPWLAVIPLQSQLCAHTAFFSFVCVSNLPLPPSCDTWDCNPVQFSSVAQSCLTHCDPMDCSTPGFPVHHQLPRLLKLMSVLVMLSNHLILCCPFCSCPQSLSASGSFPTSRFFTAGGQSIGVSASASVFPMNIQD